MVTKFFVHECKWLSDFESGFTFYEVGSQFFQFYKVASQFEFPEFQSGFTFLNFYELRGGFANYPDNFNGPVPGPWDV